MTQRARMSTKSAGASKASAPDSILTANLTVYCTYTAHILPAWQHIYCQVTILMYQPYRSGAGAAPSRPMAAPPPRAVPASQAYTHALSLTHTLSLSFSHSHSLFHTHIHSLSLTHTHSVLGRPHSARIGVEGAGFRVEGSAFSVEGSAFRVQSEG